MAKPVDLLSEYSIGDRLRAEDVNSLIAFAKRASRDLGYSDGDVVVQQYRPPNKTPVFHLKNDLGESIPPFSVFSISDSSDFTYNSRDPAKGLAAMHDIEPNGSPLLFLTNGPIEIPYVEGEEPRQFEAQIVGFDKPTKVRATTDSVPDVGEQCGIVFGEMRVGSYRYGLVCLSPSWTENEEIYVWVCRSREPIKVVGCVTEKIDKARIVNGKRRLGVGFIQVLYRDGVQDLNEVNRPAYPAVKWNLRVYNYNDDREYEKGVLVSATDTLGIGLTVNYETKNTLCAISSSSQSSRSSSSISRFSQSSISSIGSAPSKSSKSALYPPSPGCCDEYYGPWYNASWPDQFTVRFSGAPCAPFNQDVIIYPDAGAAEPTYISDPDLIFYTCDGVPAVYPGPGSNPSWKPIIKWSCGTGGGSSLQITIGAYRILDQVSPADTTPESVDMTISSCLPFNAFKLNAVIINGLTNNNYYDGYFDVEVFS